MMLSCSKEYIIGKNLIINSQYCQKEYVQATVTALIHINISGPLYSSTIWEDYKYLSSLVLLKSKIPSTQKWITHA